MNVKGGTAFSELASLLKTPLKVEFANNKVAIVSDITLNIDGHKFMEKTYSSKVAIRKQVEARNGQEVG